METVSMGSLWKSFVKKECKKKGPQLAEKGGFEERCFKMGES